jgi:hypothetical protein
MIERDKSLDWAKSDRLHPLNIMRSTEQAIILVIEAEPDIWE